MMELFTTNVGSHMWKMNHAGSDRDLTTVYLMDSRDFLLGKIPKGKHFVKNEANEDIQQIELGHLISLVKRGNVNAIWMVMSPIKVSEKGNALNELKSIISTNLSKECYYSIEGLARHNIYHFLEKGDPQSFEYKKKIGIIGRTLLFGINVLTWGKCWFKKSEARTYEDILILKQELETAKELSKLPEKSNPEPFNQYLIKYRLLGLKLDEFIS